MSQKRRRTTGQKARAALFLTAMWVGSIGLSAQAQTWRCGSTYSDRPCEGGKQVKVEDHRSEHDRRAADAGARSAQTQADQLERTRLSQEKAAHDRDRHAAREARSAAQSEKRLALSEQRERDHARKALGEPRKSSMSFKGPAAEQDGGDAPKKKKKRKSAD
jgi:hypothetical protein